MHAAELITHEIPPLRPTDTIARALDWMEEFKVTHLPVVESRTLLGIVTDSDLVDRNDVSQPVSVLKEHYDPSFAEARQHIYDVMKLFSERGLSVVPVVDANGRFMGSISEHEALRQLAIITNINEPGSVVVLEMNSNDYSLQQIAGIVEGNDAKVISAISHILPDPKRLEVILKIDREDISAVLQTFERYEYMVKNTYQSTLSNNDLRGRFEELMRFINM